MRKPTPKQISLKTSWSPDDEVEFFEALSRVKKEHAKAVMLMRRAKAIKSEHPEVAITLLERCLTGLPEIIPYQQRLAAEALGGISIQMGDTEIGALHLRAYSKHRLSKNEKDIDAICDYMKFIAENHVESHYQDFIDLALRAKHDHPRSDLPTSNTLGLSWNVFCAAAYFADCLNDKSLSETFLEKAEALKLRKERIAPDPWRLWLFKKIHLGSRNVAFVLARPEFSLSEMQDWAKQNWTAFRPEMTYTKTETGERLILMWQDFAVDLVIYDDAKTAQNFASYFKKKNLGKFQTEGARALRWKDAGDYDAIDAINTSIELLDYFRDEPRIAVNIG